MGVQEEETSMISSSVSSLAAIDTAEGQLLQTLTRVKYEKLRVQLSSGEIINAVVAGPKHAKPIVIMHGWGAGLGFFGGVLEGLSFNYRVYLVDWLGCGASTRPYFHSAWSPLQAEEFFVGSLDEWINKVDGLDRGFVLVGHSLGGFLSVELALREYKRVKGLVLVSPVGVGMRNREKVVKGGWLRWLLLSLLFLLWEYGCTPQMIMRMWGLGWWFANWIIKQRWGDKDEQLIHSLTNYFYEISRAKPSGERALNTILESGAWAKIPLCKKLPKIKCPTLFLYGDRDWMDWNVGDAARNDMNVWTDLERVPNAGHHIYLDNPNGFNTAILNACKRFQQHDTE